MADKITIEDYNTWQYLFGNTVSMLTIPLDNTEKDTDLYTIYKSNSNWYFQFKVNLFNNTERVYYWLQRNQTPKMILSTYSNNTITISENDMLNYNSLVVFVSELTFEKNSTTTVPAFIPVAYTYLLFDGDDLTNRDFYMNTILNNPTLVAGLNEEGEVVKQYTSIKDGNYNKVPLDVISGRYLGFNTKVYKINSVGVYEPPLVMVEEPLYIGCTNHLQDNVNCPVSFEAYINNKKYVDFKVPVDITKNELLVNIKTKSEYPYLPFDNYISIPIEYKFATSMGDLNNYEYVKLSQDLQGFEAILNGVNNTIDLNGHELSIGKITNEKQTLFINGNFNTMELVNNNELTITNCTFNGQKNKIINNGTLNINDCLVNKINIINNGNLNIINSNLDLTATTWDFPTIHNTNNYNITNNTITVSGTFTDNNIIFIRGLNEENNLLTNNNWNYNAEYVEEEITYTITGNGFVYSNIDEDTLILKNLEVVEDV